MDFLNVIRVKRPVLSSFLAPWYQPKNQKFFFLYKVFIFPKLIRGVVTMSVGIFFLIKKSLLKVSFFPKRPCNIDYFTSIQDTGHHRRPAQRQQDREKGEKKVPCGFVV